MGFFRNLFKKKPRVLERTPMDIRIGDIVMHYGTDYEVFAVIDWMEEGYGWKEYKLKSGESSCWISAEVDDGEMALGFYEVRDDIPWTENQVQSTLEYEGTVFKLIEQGQATGSIRSGLGEQALQCRYFEYQADERIISVEQYGGETEKSIGKKIHTYDLDILPGGD